MARVPYEDEIIISWVELHRDARFLSEELHRKGPWKGIIAVTRGGLVPAALVARELDIRLVDTVVKEFKQTKWIFFPWDIEYKFATPIKDGGRAPAPE